ncbi:BTB/POZ domain-containing protein 6-B isoform X2 [Frieseomelitta varia]|uniref:BTB/POZ domain-containing protein 6-B isoform X2 n=1 Tax=Frieseomelitta varia TaxID=561572 RepID=UPI001CB67C7B|nr:BTB/POZ domain-containing protein 6-B isoform X2 [Frieseomelitta varia]
MFFACARGIPPAGISTDKGVCVSQLLFTQEGDSSRCARTEPERARQKVREGVRNRIYSRTIILPVMAQNSSRKYAILQNSEDMSRVPFMIKQNTTKSSIYNMVILEAGLPGDTWRYCVEREQLAERSEWFRAMLVGPLAPAPSNPPPVLKLQHIEKRAFDYLLRYVLEERINFQSVTTARATLDAAHQYLCPELARYAVEYLESNLNSNTVLEIYQGLNLYADCVTYTFNSPTAPPAPGDDAGEIAAACTRLLLSCLDVIDSEPEAVFSQEFFEELSCAEVEELACRDTLRLNNESILFHALNRWAASKCRRHGLEPSASNKRSALSDDVWYSVRYSLMSDKEFIEGPMASGILSSEESAYIVARILGHQKGKEDCSSVNGPFPRLTNNPRIDVRMYEEQNCKMSKSEKKECQDNRKNSRKECVNQGQRTCARIGNYLVRVLACIFD